MGVYGATQISANVLKVLRQEVKGRAVLHLRVVSWIIDGRESDVRVEKRERIKSGGGEYDGNIKGLNRHDVAFLLEHADEVRQLMGIRPLPTHDYTEPVHG